MHLLYFIPIIVTVQAALGTPRWLQARAEERFRCDSPDHCVYSYTTGSAQCSSGFTRYHLEARGDPPGSYCERPCDTSERTACNKNNCNYYEQQCNLYPKDSPDCQAAVRWCDGPVSMLKTTCTSSLIGQTVSYDDSTHLCIPAGKTATSRQAMALRLGSGTSFNVNLYDTANTTNYVNLHCFDLDYPSAQFLAEVAAAITMGCTTLSNIDQGNTGYDSLNIKCQTLQADWKNVTAVLSQGCWESAPFKKDKGPYYNSLLFRGQPK